MELVDLIGLAIFGLIAALCTLLMADALGIYVRKGGYKGNKRAWNSLIVVIILCVILGILTSSIWVAVIAFVVMHLIGIGIKLVVTDIHNHLLSAGCEEPCEK